MTNVGEFKPRIEASIKVFRSDGSIETQEMEEEAEIELDDEGKILCTLIKLRNIGLI